MAFLADSIEHASYCIVRNESVAKKKDAGSDQLILMCTAKILVEQNKDLFGVDDGARTHDPQNHNLML
jgi:hypothetical protein